MGGLERCFAKFVEKYNCNAQNLTDILRCSIVFTDINDLTKAVNMISEFSDKEQKFSYEIVRIKDRFTTPTPGNYSDLLMNIRWKPIKENFLELVIEVQFHLEDLYAVKNEGGGHDSYDVAGQFYKRFGALAAKKCDRSTEVKGQQQLVQLLKDTLKDT